MLLRNSIGVVSIGGLTAALLAFVATSFLMKTESGVKSGSTLQANSFVHDFGIVRIDEGFGEVSHVFNLRNDSGNAIQVAQVTASCGCLEAVLEPMTIDPGGAAELRVVTEVASAGVQVSNIWVIIDDGSVLTFTVKALGQRAVNLVAARGVVTLSPSKAPVTAPIFATMYDSDEAPDTPTIESADQLSVEFSGWSLVSTRFPHVGQPARWEGELFIRSNADLSSASRLVVSLAGGPDVKITVIPPRSSPAARTPVGSPPE